MTSPEYLELIQEALRRQRGALRLQIIFAGTIVLFGIFAVLAAQIVPRTLVATDQKWLVTLGGTFISTLCGFPVHQISSGRERIGALETVARLLVHAAADKATLDPRLEDRIWRTLDKALGL